MTTKKTTSKKTAAKKTAAKKTTAKKKTTTAQAEAPAPEELVPYQPNSVSIRLETTELHDMIAGLQAGGGCRNMTLRELRAIVEALDAVNTLLSEDRRPSANACPYDAPAVYAMHAPTGPTPLWAEAPAACWWRPR